MALPLQAVKDPATDQNFRRIAQQFPITGGNLAKRSVVGAVNSAGAVVAGEGFTVEHSVTGIYKVVLSVELRASGVLLGLTAVNTTNADARCPTATAKKTFEIVTFQSTTGVTENSGFNFEIKEP